MKKVLLLGDSIRLGYQPYIQEGLKGEAQVWGSQDNGRYSKYTLWGVNLWIKEFGIPDIVHWNNGLWDLHHEAPMVEALTLLDEYLENLKRIINELERTGAKIIFATTIPVPPDATGRSNAEIDRYNAAATALMQSKNIAINDLNQLVRTDMEAHICEDRLHLTELGYKRCAEQAIAMIRTYL
ncbi:SGNH/GDSL hydrolase family protein [Paenibacillus marinisediminis]